MNVYLAGPIFCEGDRMRNEKWSAQIRNAIPRINLYNPLENKEINDKTKCASSWQIADGDNARLDETDVLIACIDGDVIPSGTSAEIGKFQHHLRGQIVHDIVADILQKSGGTGFSTAGKPRNDEYLHVFLLSVSP